MYERTICNPRLSLGYGGSWCFLKSDRTMWIAWVTCSSRIAIGLDFYKGIRMKLWRRCRSSKRNRRFKRIEDQASVPGSIPRASFQPTVIKPDHTKTPCGCWGYTNWGLRARGMGDIWREGMVATILRRSLRENPSGKREGVGRGGTSFYRGTTVRPVRAVAPVPRQTYSFQVFCTVYTARARPRYLSSID